VVGAIVVVVVVDVVVVGAIVVDVEVEVVVVEAIVVDVEVDVVETAVHIYIADTTSESIIPSLVALA